MTNPTSAGQEEEKESTKQDAQAEAEDVDGQQVATSSQCNGSARARAL